MTDAFRQCPIAPEQQGANIVGYFSARHKAWLFAEVWGMVYGVRSSVCGFSRFPTLAAAAARRIVASMAGSYMDDYSTIDFVDAGNTAQKGIQQMVVYMGAELAPPKHTAVRTQQAMLGINVRMDRITEDGTG